MEIKKYLFYMVSMILLLSPFVSALSASTPYYVGNPLNVYPGQTLEFEMGLGNSENNTIKVEAVINNGNEIATFGDGNVFDVPARATAHPVKIKIKIPDNTPIGKQYSLNVQFNQVNVPSSGGMVSMGIAIARIIPVTVKTKEEVLGGKPPAPVKSYNNVLIIGVGILVILLIIGYYFWRKNKNKPLAAPTTVEPQQQQVQSVKK